MALSFTILKSTQLVNRCKILQLLLRLLAASMLTAQPDLTPLHLWELRLCLAKLNVSFKFAHLCKLFMHNLYVKGMCPSVWSAFKSLFAAFLLISFSDNNQMLTIPTSPWQIGTFAFPVEWPPLYPCQTDFTLVVCCGILNWPLVQSRPQ